MSSKGQDKIAIIGCGVIGMLTAWELKDEAVELTLFDQSRAGTESSWAGGGIVSPLHPWRYNDAIDQLVSWSQQRYPSLVKELNSISEAEIEFQHCGMLVFEEERPDVNHWHQAFQKYFPDFELRHLKNDQLKQKFPTFCPNKLPKSAVWMPNIAQIKNPGLMAALRQHFQSRLMEQSRVERIIITNNQVTAVEIEDGQRYKVDKVLISAGAWSERLAKQIGIELPIYPVKGQMIRIQAHLGVLPSILVNNKRYLIPRGDGSILVGSTVEHTDYDKSTTIAAKDELYQAAIDLVPELGSNPITHHWSGLRPGTDRKVPIISADPTIKGLFISTGHFRNGLVTAPASARLMADLMLQREPILNPEMYS